jgi:hypothetical protein
VLSGIAATLARGGQPEAAADAAHNALQAAISTDNPYSRSEALKKVAVSLAAARQPGHLRGQPATPGRSAEGLLIISWYIGPSSLPCPS